MGIKTKLANGPNPLSVKKRIDRKNGQELPPKKKRVRKGKRTKRSEDGLNSESAEDVEPKTQRPPPPFEKNTPTLVVATT
jgi:hypothetical protein